MSASTIRIAVPNSSGSLTRYFADLQLFFNNRFQLYGRHIVLDPCCSTTATTDPVKERADADAVASRGDFASLAYTPESGGELFYYDELAAHHVISVGTYGTWRSEVEMAAHAPYEWSLVGGGNDIGESGLGGFVCNQLKGRPAEYAGAPYGGQPRRFGLLETTLNSYGADDSRLRSVLLDCGVTIAAEARYDDGGSAADTSNGAGAAQTAMVRFRQAGVTTVICLCEAYATDTTAMPAAANQGYFPEWLLSTYLNGDIAWAGHLAPASEAAHFFGLSFMNKDLPAPQQPVSWALKEVDPGFAWAQGSSFNAQSDATSAQWYLYDDLLILASGIQMAGPGLTPGQFQSALFRTRFPNPACGGPPYYQACVGFPNVHSWYQDVAVIWWSPTTTAYSTDNGAGTGGGAYCSAELGARHSPYSWSSQPEILFGGPCR